MLGTGGLTSSSAKSPKICKTPIFHICSHHLPWVPLSGSCHWLSQGPGSALPLLGLLGSLPGSPPFWASSRGVPQLPHPLGGCAHKHTQLQPSPRGYQGPSCPSCLPGPPYHPLCSGPSCFLYLTSLVPSCRAPARSSPKPTHASA